MKEEEVKSCLDNALEVLNAYKEGKKIEVKGKEYGDWTDFDERSNTFFNFENCNYRVKKEEKYRPYSCAKEFNDAKRLSNSYLVSKQHGDYLFPIYFDDERVLCYTLLDKKQPMKEIITYDNLLKYYTWTDNIPCGCRIGE